MNSLIRFVGTGENGEESLGTTGTRNNASQSDFTIDTRFHVALNESGVNLIHGFAAAFMLQWCAVLIAAGMLRLRLWV